MRASIIESLVLSRQIEREQEGLTRFVFPSRSEEGEKESYVGGFVMDPPRGVIENVAVLDLVSIYPAIIMAFNVGFETFREDKSGEILAPHGSFVREPRSSVAEVLGDLIELRSHYKKLRNQYHPDSTEYKIYDGMQFGVKFIINASYGVLGFEKSRLYRWEIAENITLYARSILNFLNHYFTSLGYRVVYSDSVTGDTCIIVRKNGVIMIQRIDEFEGEWIKRFDGKEVLLLDDWEVYTMNGWKKLRMIVRRKADKPVRVWDFRWSVPAVTDDHSLISFEGKEVKPHEITDISQLMYVKPPKIEKIIENYKGFELDYELGYLLGMYVADGSASKVVRITGTRDKKLAKHVYELAKKKFCKVTFVKGRKRERKYYVHLKKPESELFIELCGKGADKKAFPDFFLSTPLEFQEGLIDGYLDGDGRKNRPRERGFICSTVSRKLMSQLVIWAIYQGATVRIHPIDLIDKPLPKGYKREEQSISYRITATFLRGGRSMGKALAWARRHKIEKITLENVDYIYDISTDDGTFVDAAGLVVLHNTDSIFVHKKNIGNIREWVRELEEFREKLRKWAAIVYNSPFTDVLDIKIDRVAVRAYFSGKKKRYALLSVYEDGEWIAPYVHSKGFEIVRSDWAKIA